jgi:hypothetical protein
MYNGRLVLTMYFKNTFDLYNNYNFIRMFHDHHAKNSVDHYQYW